MADLNDVISEHQKMLDEYNKLRAEFQERGKKVLKDSFKGFFDANPKIRAVSWTQYTPYFNDGEPCTFSVHDMWALDKKGYNEWKDNGGYAEEYSVASNWAYGEPEGDDRLTAKERKSVQDFLALVHKLPDDLFEDMFGDHVEVIATREGFEVEEYSHD